MHEAHDGKQHYEAEEDRLPPGPWHAKGNKVMAGNQTVAVIVCRNASAVARMVARFPELLAAEPIECVKHGKRIDELEDEVDMLQNEVEKLREAL